MFSFEIRDEGFLAVRTADGKAVAHVEAAEITLKEDPRLKAPERVRTPMPQEKWLVHFTATRLSLAELAALAQELAAQK